MNRRAMFTITLALSLLSFGCGQGPVSKSAESDQKVAEAKEQTKDAAQATAAAAEAKRDEYVLAMQKRLSELDAQLAELNTRSNQAEGEVKKNLEQKAATAKAKRDIAAARLDEVKAASADRWEKVKDGFGNALDELKKAFE